jgi:hypothetical protein
MNFDIGTAAQRSDHPLFWPARPTRRNSADLTNGFPAIWIVESNCHRRLQIPASMEVRPKAPHTSLWQDDRQVLRVDHSYGASLGEAIPSRSFRNNNAVRDSAISVCAKQPDVLVEVPPSISESAIGESIDSGMRPNAESCAKVSGARLVNFPRRI